MALAGAAAITLALVLAPVGAAEIDAGRLVLRQSDVPPGFRLDARQSGVRTNAAESRSGVAARRLIARSGRTTGYEVEFDRQELVIDARVDLFRRASGARMFLDWIEAEYRKAGVLGLVPTRAAIGAGGWVYAGRRGSAFVLVVWRYDRAFAGVVATGLSKPRTLALARTQQRRIAAALR
jgi:hypothetical protein